MTATTEPRALALTLTLNSAGRPEGTLGCSHGWSESATGGRTKPVGKFEEKGIAPKGRRKMDEEVYANAIRGGEASLLLRPVGAVSLGYVAIHGLRPPVGGLHPWLEPAAPCGAKAVVRELWVRLRALADSPDPPTIAALAPTCEIVLM